MCRNQHLLLPGAKAFHETGVLNYSAWASVRCKNGDDFLGIGLQDCGLKHVEEAHPGEGIEDLNIYCRICDPSPQLWSMSYFDDLEDLKEHMDNVHRYWIAQIKTSPN